MATLTERRSAKPRRAFRFTLRSLLIAITLFGVWLGWRVDRAHRQRDAVRAIRACGGNVTYDYQVAAKKVDARPSEPAWLIELVGVDFFHKVEGVNFPADPYNPRAEYDAEVFARLTDLPDIVFIRLRGAQACDETFAILAEFPKLESIDVEPFAADLTERTYPPLTDAGVEQLTTHPSLKDVWLGSVALGDRSLAALGKMPNLETLYVYGDACEFTDAGLAGFGGHKRITQLFIGTTSEGCDVTDRGLASLSEVKTLGFLGVRGRTISDVAFVKLADDLPALTDLEVASDQLTKQGIAEFAKRSKTRLHLTRYTSVAEKIRRELMAAHSTDDDRLPRELSVSNLSADRREYLIASLADIYFKYEHRKRDDFKRRALADEALDSAQLEALLRSRMGR